MLSGENKASLKKVRAEGKVEPPTLHMAVVWPILGMTTAQQVEAGGIVSQLENYNFGYFGQG